MQIEMLDSIEDRMAALTEESLAVQRGAASMLDRNTDTMTHFIRVAIKDVRDQTVSKLRHELSLLVQENESKNSSRSMDSTRPPLSGQHDNPNIELNPSARDSSI